MPSEEENLQYLYLVLTSGGAPTIDWAAVGDSMELKPGAVSKRWSRLKTAMTEGKNPGGAAYPFLWLCVKHSAKDKALDWTAIASKCNTTPGAASKRYSRMKQAFEKGDPTPATPTKAKNPSGDEPSTPTPSKRKRAPTTPKANKPKKGVADDKYKPAANGDDPQDDDEDEVDIKPVKRTKATPTKPKATPKPKPKAKTKTNTKANVKTESTEKDPIPQGSTNLTEASTLIKSENNGVDANDKDSDNQDQFFDAETGEVEDEVSVEGPSGEEDAEDDGLNHDRVESWLDEI
ncbi:hypothetical protein BDV95DRAFT_343450 [Massariosphaeria phaeospora]|uniref:Myb-like DNA-binding domain-containing protein n=1 Tax=Massariosphaeria phaeospora TaxID=100035 RepID=A0A7C8MNC7_9PLEO|nr:hypothetical protein BDV95DRAFT_343450 [Massariosphaeria phaeospora]